MAKTAMCIWLFAGTFFAARAQTDTATTVLPDSAGVNHTRPAPETVPDQKVKTWPIATAVALILISSYLLYNVRSR